MDDSETLCCALCLRGEETETTGPLSTKDDVTAHQNCLLFSSGLYCRDSPQFDDLFGFTVEDVLDEVKRGSKLICNKCKKKGATAGCENTRCKKSYHYPCAVKDGAKNVEDAEQGRYGLFCSNHYQMTQRHSVPVNGGPSTSNRASEAGSSKVYCLACKKTEGNISLDSLHSIVMLYCQRHAPASHQSIANGDVTAARRLSVCSSDSDSCSIGTRPPAKRKLNFRHKEGGSAKRKARLVIEEETDDSSNPDEEPDMVVFAPIDTDLDESATSVPETQLIRKEGESPTGSPSAAPVDQSVQAGDDGDDPVVHSDAESESLLLPASRTSSAGVSTRSLSPCVVLYKMEAAAQGPDRGPASDSGPVQSPVRTAPPPFGSKPPPPYRSPQCSSSLISPAAPGGVPLPRPPPPPLAGGFRSSSFWKSCNAAGCTQALFTGFIDDMNAVSSRIQSDRASQEDYDRALTVMTASGKLAALVAEQQEDLQRREAALLKAAAAMREVVTALETRGRQQEP